MTRPRCSCGQDLKPSPGRVELCCYTHMPPIRQEWRRVRSRVRRSLPHAVVLVRVETYADEGGQVGMVEA